MQNNERQRLKGTIPCRNRKQRKRDDSRPQSLVSPNADPLIAGSQDRSRAVGQQAGKQEKATEKA